MTPSYMNDAVMEVVGKQASLGPVPWDRHPSPFPLIAGRANHRAENIAAWACPLLGGRSDDSRRRSRSTEARTRAPVVPSSSWPSRVGGEKKKKRWGGATLG